MASKTVTVRVESARGHGVHGLMPGEGAFCEVSLPGAEPQEAFTRVAQPSKMPHPRVEWGQEFTLTLAPGSGAGELAVALHGRRVPLDKPLGPHSDDLIGRGSCSVAALLEGSTRQVVLVPLRSSTCHDVGEVELVLRMHAAPQ